MRALAAVALAGALVARGHAAPPPDLDATVEKAMKRFDVPGLAIAIVEGDQVVLARGYGVKRLGATAKVGPDTIFGIASLTKAFTAAALAILVDEGKLSWDDRAAERLPGFALRDPYASREVTIRDLLSHRTGLGLGSGDLMHFPPSTLSRQEILARVPQLPAASSLRSRYAYHNLMFIAAGEIVARVSGKTWEAFVAERLFRPLGMRRTVAGDAVRAGDVATPHARIKERATAVAPDRVDNLGPAGSIHSSVNDLARWLVVLLAQGRLPDGKPLFTEAQARAMWTPQIALTFAEPPPPPIAKLAPAFSTYGLGWGVRDYHGRRVIGHTGLVTGYASRIGVVPESRLGVVILTNAESFEAHTALFWHVVDHYLKVAPTDWVAAFAEAREIELRDAAEDERKHAAARRQVKPSLALSEYAGAYRDAWYGDVAIAVERERLVVRFSRSPSLVGDLEPWHHETFRVTWRDPTVPDAFLSFVLDVDGAITHVEMEAVSPLADFSYDFHDLDLRRVKEVRSR